MIVNAIEKVREAGITDVYIVTNVGEQELQKAIGDGSNLGIRITYFEQKGGALGLAHVVKMAEPYIGNEPFLFYLGDNIILGSIKPFVDQFANSDLHCMLALSKVKDPQRFGVPEIKDGKIVGVVEKPKDPKSNFAVTGIYLYEPVIFDAVKNISPSERGELEISDAHQYLLDAGKLVGYKEITGWWKDTGKPEDLLEGNQLLLQELEPGIFTESIHQESRIEGKVRIGRGTTIGKNVVIRGPVTIGDSCVIENAYIGPYASIGDSVQIQRAEIEHSIVMTGAQIDCDARIIDSIIGSEAKVLDEEDSLPHGHKLIIGEHSSIEL